MRQTLMAAAVAAFAWTAVQGAAFQDPPAQPPGGGQRGRGAGPGPQGGGRSPNFPQHQRPPGDPAVIARGRALYGVNCTACHGADLRGGDQGGPNLLRSQIVLTDQHGENILPSVRNGRQGAGGLMPAFNFFTVDRVTGEHVATSQFGSVANWAKGLDDKGRPVLNPEKVATIPGAIVNGSTTNWPPPAYSPDTGLFYVPENNALSIAYLIDPDPRGSMGLGGRQASGIGSYGNYVTAIDPKTGRIAWRHQLPGGSGPTGMLTTGGGLLFAGDGSGNLVAFDAANGTPLWNARLGNVTNAPQTYTLDGRQHVLVAAGDLLYAFRLN